MKKKIFTLGLIYAALCLLSLAVSIKLATILLLVGILALLAFAALLYINKSVKKTQWYKSVIPNMSLYPTNEWYREHLERNFDVVNIGSSSARYAFDYSGLPVKAFNWGEQPQSLNNGFKILKTYFSILKKGGTVIISLGPLSGLDVEGKWQKDANDKYYYILPSELINNYSSVAKRRNYPLVYYPITSIKNLLRRTSGKENGQNTELIKTFVDDSDKWIKIWKDEFGITSFEEPLSEANNKGKEKRIALLKEILAFCIERDLRPAIVIPPMHCSLASKFTPAFRENYIYSFVYKANIFNVPFLNYMDDERFDDDKYFYNSFFLNEEGAKKFTNIVLKDLKVL